MKGLLIKDLRLLLQRKKAMAIILVCGAAMGFSADLSFLAGWFMLIGALFSLSTIAYDEYDNCYPFLMTLPVTRKTYAVEKYLFGLLAGFGAWLLALIICVIALAARKAAVDFMADVMPLLALLPIPLVLLDLCLPIHFKYGSERSRTVLIIVWGVVFAAVMIGKKLLPKGFALSMPIKPLSGAALTVFVILVLAALTLLSVGLSVRIMEKKEF